MAIHTEDKMPSLGIEGLQRPADPGHSPLGDSALFKIPGEVELVMGNDGDDVGQLARDQTICDMLDSGHGFLVRRIEATHTRRRVSCEVCDGPLPTPGADPDWLCQYYDETQPASLDCNCAWCLAYQDYLAGKYKPQGGRPRQRCGAAACEREADKLRKRRKRLLAKANETDWPEPTREDTEAALAGLDKSEVPERYREGIRAKLTARLATFDGYQPPVSVGRPRRRNEPNWWLSGQVKRGLVHL